MVRAISANASRVNVFMGEIYPPPPEFCKQQVEKGMTGGGTIYARRCGQEHFALVIKRARCVYRRKGPQKEVLPPPLLIPRNATGGTADQHLTPNSFARQIDLRCAGCRVPMGTRPGSWARPADRVVVVPRGRDYIPQSGH